jgi:hypothetical protein
MSEVKNQVAAQLRADLMMMAHNRWNMGMDAWNNVSNNILRAADLLDALSHPAPNGAEDMSADTDKLSAMTLAIMEAGAEFREHSKFNADVTELVLASALGPAIRAAILAYLSALVEDYEMVEACARAINISAGGNSHWTFWEKEAHAVLHTLATRAQGESS